MGSFRPVVINFIQVCLKVDIQQQKVIFDLTRPLSLITVRSLLLHFCFANKSVGAIIRARIKTIRASEERVWLHDAIRARQETSPGGQGDTGHRQPIRGQCSGHVTCLDQSEASVGDPQEVKCPATCSIRRVSQSHPHHRFIKNKNSVGLTSNKH